MIAAYVHIQSRRYPLSLSDIRHETPDTSWPEHPSEDALRHHGYASVMVASAPTVGAGWIAVENGCVLGEDDVYRTGWVTAPAGLSNFAADQSARVASINQHRDDILAAGFPYGGKLFDVSDSSLVRFAGMTLAATLSVTLSAPWDHEYADGWIAMDNTRMPLPTPEDGLLLGRLVGSWVAKVTQHARTLKDTIEAVAFDPVDPAASFTALAAIDITAGWPA